MFTKCLLLCLLCVFNKIESKLDKLIRGGYVYINETNNFYHLRNDATPFSWLHAKAACELEEGTLFFPENEHEAETVIAHFRDSWTTEKIYVGIAKPNAIPNQIDAAEGFKTMDGRALEDVYSNSWSPHQPNNEGNEYCVCMSKDKLLHDYPCLRSFEGFQFICKKTVASSKKGLPIEDVYDNWAPGEPNNAGGVEECVVLRREGILNDDRCDKAWPYICKKTEASLRWNDLCDIPDPEYTYYEKTGRCYKLHLTPKNWKDAYTTCSYEQSRLAVIDSDEEANILVNMINSSPKDLIDGDYLRGAVHLGFKYQNGWKTYRGTDLRSNGYAKWGKGQPDGRGNETCGSMFYNGLLNDIGCDVKCFFICEHEIRLLQTALDYKFGEDA